MQIINVKFLNDEGEPKGRGYSYYSQEKLAAGDIVSVPVKDYTMRAQVTTVDIPESSISQSVLDVMRIIPTGSRIEPAELDSNEKPNPRLEIEAKKQIPDPGVANRMRQYLKANAPEMLSDEEKQMDNVESGEPANGNFAEAQQQDGSLEYTAVIVIGPERNPAVIQLKAEIIKLKSYADRCQITRIEDITPANNDLALISKLKKALKAKEDEYCNPVDAQLKAMKAVFKELQQILVNADTTYRNKLKDFDKAQKDRADQAEAINRQKEELARKEAAFNGTGEITINTEPVETPTIVQKVRTESGTLSFIDDWKWEVENIELVPRELFILDRAAVTRRVKSGERKIPGIRIFNAGNVKVITR